MRDIGGIIVDAARLTAEAMPLLRKIADNGVRLHELTERLVRMEGHADEIHAAGLDVFEKEPLSVDSPLLKLPNVVALPHIGSATHETRYNMAACAVDNLIDALRGDVSKICVNPQVAG